MDNKKLILYINFHKWWRTAFASAKSIKDRGLFYASSFRDAEFYGRPIDIPFTVNVKNPLFGDEVHVMRDLGLPLPSLGISLERRFDLDAKMMYLANAKGYDSIALMTTNGYNIYMKAGRIPRQIELQVFSPRFGTVKPIVKEHWITASWR